MSVCVCVHVEGKGSCIELNVSIDEGTSKNKMEICFSVEIV